MKDDAYYKQYEPFEGVWYIRRKLGQGTYGKVFEIERQEYGHVYKAALKVMTIPTDESQVRDVVSCGMDNESVTAYFNSFVKNISNELAIMSDLKGKTNIVSYENHRVIPHPDGIGWDILIRMELLKPLLDQIAERGMTEADVIQLGIDMCSALELCRKRKLIHRDIKPENIFISEDGDYKLGDFGIARSSETMGGSLTQGMGTINYMAPEVYYKSDYGPSVDIYSLGVVLYRLLNNNRLPFYPPAPQPITFADQEAAREKRMDGQAIPFPANGSQSLREIVVRACAFRPEDRFDTPTDMKLALEALLPTASHAVVLSPYSQQMASAVPSGFSQSGTAPIRRGEIPDYSASGRPEDGTVPAHSFVGFGEQPVSYTGNGPVQGYGGYSGTGSGPVQGYGGYSGAENGTVPVQGYGGYSGTGSGTVPARGHVNQPDFNVSSVGAADSKRPSSTKRWLPFAGIGAAAVVIVVLVVLLTRGGGAPAPTPASSTQQPSESPAATEIVSEEPSAEPTPAVATPTPEWSEWSETLSASIDSDHYRVEEKQQYRSAPLHLASTPEELEELEALGDEATVISETYGEWVDSDWISGKSDDFEETENRKLLETEAVYYYDVTVTTYGDPVKMMWPTTRTETRMSTTPVGSGGNISNVRKVERYKISERSAALSYVLEAEWSSFGDERITPSDNLAVNTRTLYRSRPETFDQLSPSMDNFPSYQLEAWRQFADVKDSSLKQNISAAAAVGALSANEYLCFRPNDNITLQEAIQAAVILHRTYLGLPAKLYGKSYVEAAEEYGILRSGDFDDLNKLATRAETAFLLWKAIPSEEFAAMSKVDLISDVDRNSRFYDAIKELAIAGVISWPKPVYKFHPDDLVTREQASAFISRLAYPELRFAG